MEDGVTSDEDLGPTQQRAETKRSTRRTQSAKRNEPKCRTRIEELATPNRRLILALYQQHAENLPKDKVEKIKTLLQELYAMTPEETENYFQYLQKKSADVTLQKYLKYTFRRLMKKRKKAQQVKRAYDYVRKLLICGMMYAIKHPVPPLVSIRLRNLSNIVLEQICNLKNVDIPNRDDPDEVGYFLIQLADWIAIAIEHLYYGVHLRKNQEMEEIEEEHKKSQVKPQVANEVVDVEEVEEEGEEDAGVFSEPLSIDAME